MNSQLYSQTAMNNNFAGMYRLPPIETQRMLQDKKTSSASGAGNIQFCLDTIVEIGSPIYLYDQENRSNTSNLNKASKKITKAFPIAQETVKKASTKRHNKARNPWTPKEDLKLQELMKKYGQSWAMISSLMDGRTGKQVRDRFLNKLRPNIRCGDWSQKEDDILVSLCKEVGNRWSLIATHLPGRTEAQVKNRYYSCIKKRLENNSIFDSKTSSENATSFGSSPQEENGFDGESELEFASLNNCGVAFNNQATFNSNMTKIPFTTEEDYSERNTTQLPSPQSSSECSFDPINTIAYDDEETLFLNQMQRCGSFIVPVVENDHQLDDAITKVANYFVENNGFHTEIDSFFAENNFAPVQEPSNERLDQLTKRKAYLESLLANTLQEINTL